MTSNTFTTIQIKRSSTLAAPTTLANGELGFSFVANTLYVGSPANTPIIVASNVGLGAANMANSGLTNIAANGVVTTVNVSQLNFNNTATMNVATTANGTGTDVAWTANATAIASLVNNFQVDILANGSLIVGNSNVNFNNTSTINVNATANGTGQGNIAFSINNAVPVWTAITANSGTPPNNFIGTATNIDTAGFWVDPFGIVHLRGLISNTAGNVTVANIAGYARNIANGLPAPTAQVHVGVMCANLSGTSTTGNVVMGKIVIQTNGAVQFINVEPTAAGSNLTNISLYGITYSKF